ncbi:YbjQ family protein [Anaerolinea sp.]|uniref:YbjQ family protein n=1 Tax=Anaerolinea sp. TaxID=1872519 RepID=UPI002ACD62D3|nr:YbjQ family protein [Anaerolinea sp.]
MDRSMVTTTFGFEGYRIVRYLGVVRGITVRSRSIAGNFVGALETMVGGKITTYTELCEHARQEAFDLLIEHAEQIGANAIIGMHYDATELMESVTEVLAYGTAAVVEKI